MDYKIQKDVPIPKPVRGKPIKYNLPLEEMVVGDFIGVDLPKKKSVEHVDVAMNKKILMDKPKVTNLSTDEVIKGKVKTQKDKLKQMRGL